MLTYLLWENALNLLLSTVTAGCVVGATGLITDVLPFLRIVYTRIRLILSALFFLPTIVMTLLDEALFWIIEKITGYILPPFFSGPFSRATSIIMWGTAILLTSLTAIVSTCVYTAIIAAIFTIAIAVELLSAMLMTVFTLVIDVALAVAYGATTIYESLSSAFTSMTNSLSTIYEKLCSAVGAAKDYICQLWTREQVEVENPNAAASDVICELSTREQVESGNPYSTQQGDKTQQQHQAIGKIDNAGLDSPVPDRQYKYHECRDTLFCKATGTQQKAQFDTKNNPGSAACQVTKRV